MSTTTTTKFYTVNVWFGAEPYASVSENFPTMDAARQFAVSYKDYEDVTVSLFTPEDIAYTKAR